MDTTDNKPREPEARPTPRGERRLTALQRVLRAFMPAEEDFFELFAEVSETNVRAAKCLLAVFSDLATLPTAMAEIDEIEHIGDELRQAIVHKLNRTFVTPALFDREDIYRLAEAQDDIADLVHATVERLRTYHIDATREEALELTRILLQATEVLAETMPGLEKLTPQTTDFRRTVVHLEQEGDDITRDALTRLFEPGADALYVLKWKEIFDLLEEAIDGCRSVANLIESVVVKNA